MPASALERQTVVATLGAHSGNISHAAKDLGSSRKKLQLRMRTFGIPQGHAGRPRVPYVKNLFAGGTTSIIAISVVGLISVGAYWLWRQKKAAAATGSVRMTGLDLLGATR